MSGTDRPYDNMTKAWQVSSKAAAVKSRPADCKRDNYNIEVGQ